MTIGEIRKLEEICTLAHKLEELQRVLIRQGVGCAITITLPDALRQPPQPNRAYLETLTTLISFVPHATA